MAMATLVTPPEPLLSGGLLPLDPAVETYPVRPGGITAVEVRGDDRVRISDPHGGQLAEVTVLGAPLGPAPDAPATALRALAGTPGDAEGMAQVLAGRGV